MENGSSVISTSARTFVENLRARVSSARRNRLLRVRDFVEEYLSVRDRLVSATAQAASDFYIFGVLGLVSDENTHSDVLAWLLSRAGSHHLGPAFLKAFLERIELRVGSTLDFDLSRYSVGREVPGDGRYLDIEVNGRDFLMAIENKVEASESKDQTKDEYEIWGQKAGSRAFVPVFLSPHGSAPEEEKFIIATYEDVAACVTSLLPSVKSERVHVFLKDYAKLLGDFLSGGVTMAAFKGFSEASKFLLENWDTLKELEEMKKQIDANLVEALGGLGDTLRKKEWFISGGWRSSAEAGELRVWKPDWTFKDSAVRLQLNKLKVSDKSWSIRPWIELHIPRSLQENADFYEHLLSAGGQEIDELEGFHNYTRETAGTGYIVWKYVDFSADQLLSGEAEQIIVDEFERLRGLETVVEEALKFCKA